MKSGGKIYIPETPVKLGFFNLVSEIFFELVQSRELILRFFIRDFLAKYKQSVLGIAWAIIMPVVVMGAFIFMNKSGVLNIGKIDVPYPVFALLGLTIWQLFATGLTSTTNSIVNAGSMVIKINFPKSTLVISALAHSFFDFIIRILLVIVVFLFYRIVPAWQAVFFPFILVPLILFTLAAGLWFSLLNCVFRDVTNAVSLATTFLLFITPVLYQQPSRGIFAYISRYNILIPLVNTPRDLVLSGKVTNLPGYAIASIIALLFLIFSLYVFHLVEQKMAEMV